MSRHYKQRTDFEQFVKTLIQLWYSMPESRLAIFVNLVAIVGIFALAFTGRVSGLAATTGIVLIQGSISAFLYGLARQLEEVEEQYEEPPR